MPPSVRVLVSQRVWRDIINIEIGFPCLITLYRIHGLIMLIHFTCGYTLEIWRVGGNCRATPNSMEEILKIYTEMEHITVGSQKGNDCGLQSSGISYKTSDKP
jgi:hypothetical protein